MEVELGYDSEGQLKVRKVWVKRGALVFNSDYEIVKQWDRNKSIDICFSDHCAGYEIQPNGKIHRSYTLCEYCNYKAEKCPEGEKKTATKFSVVCNYTGQLYKHSDHYAIFQDGKFKDSLIEDSTGKLCWNSQLTADNECTNDI